MSVMYVSMYLCNVCMYVRWTLCMYACLFVRYCMHVCMRVCNVCNVCMYLCMYVTYVMFVCNAIACVHVCL